MVSLWSEVPLKGLLNEGAVDARSTALARVRFCMAAVEETRAGSGCRAQRRASEAEVCERRDMLANRMRVCVKSSMARGAAVGKVVMNFLSGSGRELPRMPRHGRLLH